MKGDTPLNSIKPGWCPRRQNLCMCQSQCVLRTDEERARANAQEKLPRATGPVEWHPRVILASDLGVA